MTDEKIYDRLAKVLALTKSPNENEASAAAEMLQKLLLQHNLEVADVEQRGQQARPGVQKGGHDLGKAAFKWKLDLADMLAVHYFCHPLVDRYRKTVAFVGRPDNVESLLHLYAWLIEQIKDLSRAQRRKHHEETGEHIDPLRYQVAFGEGAVSRLEDRLHDMRVQQQKDARSVALVLHHKTEISDWLEEERGIRIDGKRTKAQEEARAEQKKWQQEFDEAMAKQNQERQTLREECLKDGNMQPFYDQYPGEDPEVIKQREARAAKLRADEQKREERNEKRRQKYQPKGRYTRGTDWKKEDQSETARSHGHAAGDQINMTPFVKGGQSKPKGAIS